MTDIADRTHVTRTPRVPPQRNAGVTADSTHVAHTRRPWGGFDLFTLNEPATVKIITVEPGARLSLQRHEHRGEFWQVIEGVMDVEVDGHSEKAPEGRRIWVPQGAVHRMGNSSTSSARILEIAYGTFDEDDIERLEDDYSR
jgi:mannose-6-phosphate isomerase